jgi:hypothetical protein
MAVHQHSPLSPGKCVESPIYSRVKPCIGPRAAVIINTNMGIANLGGQLADKGCIGVLATAVDDPADLCGGPFNDLRSSNIGVWREVSRDK